MRIALIAPPYESVPPKLYGGTERVVYNLCRGLTERDHEVTLFASGDSVTEGRLIPIVGEALRLSKRKLIEPGAVHLRMLAEIAQYADEFDLIHNHHDYWMLPLSELSATPLLTTLHGRLDIPESFGAWSAYPAAHFASISMNQRSAAPQLPWARTVYNGVDLEDVEFYENPGSYLAFLGRIDPQKRPCWAIEMAKLAGVPIKIAAKLDPESQDYFDAHVKPHIDGKWVEFVGEISEHEKSEFLGNALALAFPIDWPEPFGLVTVEALARGTPVLARPLGAIPEIMVDGETGYTDFDIRALAKRVKDIPRISRRACRARVEERFSLQRMTEDYIDVYRSLCGEERSKNKRDKSWSFADHRGRNFVYSVERPAHRDSEGHLQGQPRVRGLERTG